MADEPRTFDPAAAPTAADVTHELQQGLGIGQRELNAQREPQIDPPLLEAGEEEWGEPTVHHAKANPADGQGAKTRVASKDAISRRS